MDEKYVTKHDLYEKLWASRDFEINHLWQRSIFLATFIVALFTIYFSVLNNFISSKSVSEDIKIELVKSTESYEGYAIAQDDKSVLVVKDDRDESLIAKPCFQLIVLDVICLFGFLFSVLWICMAKGSKYMYERHEGGIEAAHDKGSFDKELQREIDIESYEVLWASGDYTYIPRHGALPLSDYDYRLFHHNGAKYSSSKINISIGYIFAVAWGILSVVNCVIYFCDCGWFSIAVAVIAIILDVVFAFLLAYSILSDNSLSRLSFIWLVLQSTFSFSNPDKKQRKWIIKRYKGRNKSSYDYILNYVTSVLNHYGETCDNPLQKYILDKYSGRETKPFALQRLLNNEQLKNIFETALMHRDSFNEAFMGIWYNSHDIDEHLIIDRFLVSATFNEKELKIYIYNLVASSHCTFSRSMLFADTNWERIRAGQPYCLIDSTNGYHLIYKKPNGISLYMTITGSMPVIPAEGQVKYNCIDVDIIIKDCEKKDSWYDSPVVIDGEKDFIHIKRTFFRLK